MVLGVRPKKERRKKNDERKNKTEVDESEKDKDKGRIIRLRLTKNKKKVGLPVSFENRNAVIESNINPVKDREEVTTIPICPRHISTQRSMVYNTNTCNTEVVTYKEVGINHLEGGWPREIDVKEDEQVGRYRRRMEKEEKFVNDVHALSMLAETKVLQNNAIDIYNEYFDYEDGKTSERESVLESVSVFPDPARRTNVRTRPVSCVSWSPNNGQKIAVAYCSPEFLACMDDIHKDGFIFDIHNPTKHLLKLHTTSSLTSLQYNPKEENLVACGSYDGHVGSWDLRVGGNKASTVSVETHRDPVYNIIWTTSKSNSELMTACGDGTVKFWDVRNMKVARDTFIIDTENKETNSKGNIERALAASCLEYEMTIPSKFMIGAENGKILGCSRKAKNQAETITAKYKGHYGPIRCLKRNPNFTKYFLTIGDWSVKIWADDVYESPVFFINCGTELLTDGCWSSIRPSLFFLSRLDGMVEAWDIIYNQKRPILSQQIHSGPVHCLAMHEEGSLLCAGQQDGEVSLLGVSDCLSQVEKEEKSSFLQFLDRETRREKVLECIQKEKLLKEKHNKGMKSAITQIRAIGVKYFKEKSDLNCEIFNTLKDTENEAKKKFFDSIAEDEREREESGKSINYNEEYE